jgi:hypothetical protein
MPAFDVARRWKGRVVLDRTGGKLGTVLDVYYDAENDEPGVGAAGRARHGAGWAAVAAGGGRPLRLLRPPYSGASLIDLDEEEEDAAAVAPVRGLPRR